MSRAAAALGLLLASVPAWALGPLEKNDDDTGEGTAAYEAGQFDQAVVKFDAAAKKHARQARAHYNRGVALHKAGNNAEARLAFERARELDTDGKLTSKIHYNLGNVAVAEGDKKGAVRQYRQALKADPRDELARHNLEVLLRDLPPTPSAGDDGGAPDGGPGDGGSPDAGADGGLDGGADAGRPDGGTGDGGQGDGGADQSDGGGDGGSDGGQQGDGGQGDGGRGDGGEGQQDQQGDGGQSDESEPGDGGMDGGAQQQDAGAPDSADSAQSSDGGAGLSRQEAEKLLDSLKSGEKNLQLWRFKQKTRKSDSNGKDW